MLHSGNPLPFVAHLSSLFTETMNFIFHQATKQLFVFVKKKND